MDYLFDRLPGVAYSLDSGQRRRGTPSTGDKQGGWTTFEVGTLYACLHNACQTIFLTDTNSWPMLTKVSNRRSMPGATIRFERYLARLVCACVYRVGTDFANTYCDCDLVSSHFCGTPGEFRGTSGEVACHKVPEKMCSPSTPRHHLCTDFSVYRFL